MGSAANEVKDDRVRRYVRDMVLELAKISLNNQDNTTAFSLLKLWDELKDEDDAAPVFDDAA